MGNWNSHPDQNIERDPPMNFQNEQAREYYEDAVWLNEYAWVYIVGAVLIIFAVISCCYCLCSMGERAAMAKSNGYNAITTTQKPAQPAQLSAADQVLYDNMATSMSTMKSKPKSGIYPKFSQKGSVKNYSQPPPQHTQAPPPQGYMMPQYGYPYPPQSNYQQPWMNGMGQSFRAVSVPASEKAE